MELKDYLPFWKDLNVEQQRKLEHSVSRRRAAKGTLLHSGSGDCVGLFLILQGMFRAYLVSEEGREVTLYRLFERDICLFSASCMLSSIDFDIYVEAEQDTEFYHIPTEVYHSLMQESLAVSQYTNALMASRFSDVMWLLDQVLYKKLDSRLAAFLLEESRLTGSPEVQLTHEDIARHLGSAREVVTRMLKYLSGEGLVSLARGSVTVINTDGLAEIASESLR
jgi:CRP/FNR family transcriptional regulator